MATVGGLLDTHSRCMSQPTFWNTVSPNLNSFELGLDLVMSNFGEKSNPSPPLYRTTAISESQGATPAQQKVPWKKGFCLVLCQVGLGLVCGNWELGCDVWGSDGRCTHLHTPARTTLDPLFTSSHAQLESAVMRSEAVIRQNPLINRRGSWQQG